MYKNDQYFSYTKQTNIHKHTVIGVWNAAKENMADRLKYHKINANITTGSTEVEKWNSWTVTLKIINHGFPEYLLKTWCPYAHIKQVWSLKHVWKCSPILLVLASFLGVSQQKDFLPEEEIHLNFIMEIPIPGKTVFTLRHGPVPSFPGDQRIHMKTFDQMTYLIWNMLKLVKIFYF